MLHSDFQACCGVYAWPLATVSWQPSPLIRPRQANRSPRSGGPFRCEIDQANHWIGSLSVSIEGNL